MKLTDYIAYFFVEQQIKDIFVLTGASSVHIIDSIAKNKNLNYVSLLHEQSNSFAAEAYSRCSNSIGIAVSTSGPGAINMLTGIANSYYDSIAVLYITGQVPSSQIMSNDDNLRQLGFQETDVISLTTSITKYSVQITNPLDIKKELQKAFYIAQDGRNGPVVLDIPDDIQRADINPETLEGFIVPTKQFNFLDKSINSTLQLISNSKKPLFLFGAGVQDVDKTLLINLLKISKIPFVLTWGAIDKISHTHSLFAGTFGTHGTRYGNFAIANADLLICIGTRLDNHSTGTNLSLFAKNAKKIIVDIDKNEIKKHKHIIFDLSIIADATAFIEQLNLQKINSLSNQRWIKHIEKLKLKYPICEAKYQNEPQYVNPYYFNQILSSVVNSKEIIVTDTGSTLVWAMQAIKIKQQKLFHAFNNTPMGYALPASIGVSFIQNNITCITGDGALQMNIQELASVVQYKLPIKILVFNNYGYNMIKHTQTSWLNGKFEATDANHGVAIPDFSSIAKAYKIKVVDINNNSEVKEKLEYIYSLDEAVFCNINIDPEAKHIPRATFGKPIEELAPLLQEKEYKENFINE